MLKLVKLNEDNYPLLIDMMDEWTATGEKIVPWAIVKAEGAIHQRYWITLN